MEKEKLKNRQRNVIAIIVISNFIDRLSILPKLGMDYFEIIEGILIALFYLIHLLIFRMGWQETHHLKQTIKQNKYTTFIIVTFPTILAIFLLAHINS